MSLRDRKCVPCEGGVEPLRAEKVAALLREVRGWEARGNRIVKTFRFANFVNAMEFVNAMAGVAETQGHHPDFAVHYNRVEVTLWTHAIGGLSDNDFIVAAKLDEVTGDY